MCTAQLQAGARTDLSELSRRHLSATALDRSSTSITRTAQLPSALAQARVITDEASRRVLLSTRNHPGEQCAKAPLGRRRSDPAAACRCSRQSRALAGGLTAEGHGCRVPRVPPTATRFGIPAASWWRDVRMPTVPCSPCPRPPSASACPASTGPASGAYPASACLVSDARCPCPRSRAPCPTSGVRCPVRASGIGAYRVRVRSIRTGEFVQGEGAAGCVHVGRSVLPAAGHDLSPWVVGRPRWEALWPTARACAAPPRPKAAGGPSTAVRPGGETGSDLGEL